MKLASLELDYKEYTISICFDKLDSLKLKHSLQVCTCETIRGKNKTFNAFRKPTIITLTGKFSDKISTNILVSYKEDTYIQNGESSILSKTLEIQKINKYVGKDKSNKLNNLFNNMIENTRLLDVKTFYKTYENYVITSFNLVYVDNSTISVDLNLQEVLLKDSDDYAQTHTVTYSQPEILTSEEFNEVANKVEGGVIANGK